MKRLGRAFIVITLLGAFAASFSENATPVDKTMANNFFASCLNRQDPRMSPDTQEAMCACNAAMIMQNMTVEEVQTMKEQTQAGRDMLNKMLLEVYTPCINYPVHDLVEAECLRNENIDKAGIAMPKAEICGCTAKKMSEWFAKDGGALMRTILEKQPNIYDPIEPVMNSKAFKSQSYSIMIACMTDGN